MKPKVLIIDDEQALVRSMELLLRPQYTVKTLLSIDSAIQFLSNESVDAIVTDLNFHGQSKDGTDLIDWLNSRGDQTPVIILSGETDVKRVMDAQRRIVDDFLIKPVEAVELVTAIEKARQRGSSNQVRVDTKYEHEVLTQDVRILAALEQIRKVVGSSTNLPICVYGESGTGKEELAKFAASLRNGPFVAVNMAALSANLAESELFGHVRGAFTGALLDKKGKFQAAHGGVLFLDEIGDCPLDLQVKLFRALQEKEVTRVGSNVSENVDVRIITATNQDLRALVKAGKFREELLYRIEGAIIALPPLRDRPNDIPMLVGKFIQQLSPKARPASISRATLAVLQAYSWPGNVRELKTVVEQALLEANMRLIDVHHLPQRVLGIPAAKEFSKAMEGDESLHLETILARTERLTILRALERSKNNKALAAKFLSISPSTLYRRAVALQIQDFGS